VALIGQWRYSLHTDKLTATMQLAQRVYAVAQAQNDAALLVGGDRALAVTFYFRGEFEAARRHLRRGVEGWRSAAGVPSSVEELDAPVVSCLSFKAVCEWHLGEIGACRATMAEAISLAKALNDLPALAVALYFAGALAQFEGHRAEVERRASELMELSTRLHFAHWRAVGAVLGGWARSASGETVEGLAWIEEGIEGWRAPGSMLLLPYWLALKAEALNFAGRTSEALVAVQEAEALAERSGEHWWRAELYRLRGVFLATLGADEAQIEAAFHQAVGTAERQNSISLRKRAEASHAEYRRQRGSRQTPVQERPPAGSCDLRLGWGLQ
jgi:adenylate cyclase